MTIRAIDLYSGIGGWGVGLRLAGIDVVAAYEWWKPAASTYAANLGPHVTNTDIRNLELAALPENIDLVVGSPPCTEFSYANRGGSGDIDEGLKDIRAFLRIVRHLKPRWWIMENVQRVKNVLEKELSFEGQLAEYADLVKTIDVVDLSQFGVPQKRKRCVVGDFPRDLLFSYGPHLREKTLGGVLRGLTQSFYEDISYGISLPAERVTDHIKEAPLNAEELRMNQDAKTFHPIYNNMPFPDPADRPVRTITATCTRVSRESVIINDPESPGAYRRLTIRERALLQGFPINFQFFSERHTDKAKMVGNAIPPTFTYLLAHAVKGTAPAEITSPAGLNYSPVFSLQRSPYTPPESQPGSYPKTRRFRAAIPNLRFKSGVRFELANHFTNNQVEWRVDFYYGTSKKIIRVPLDETVWENLQATGLLEFLPGAAAQRLLRLKETLETSSPDELQAAWSHQKPGRSPYELVDNIGGISAEISGGFSQLANDWLYELVKLIINLDTPIDSSVSKQLNGRKLSLNSAQVLSGMVVGCVFNAHLSKERFDTMILPEMGKSVAPPLDRRTDDLLVAQLSTGH